MASNTVIVRVLGNTSSLSKSLNKARKDLQGLDNINRNLAAGFKVAAIGAAAFGAAAVGAGVVGTAALAAMPLAIAGIGIAFAAQNEKVKKSFSGLKDYVLKEGQRLAQPLVQPLIKGAEQLKKAFDAIAPSLQKVFRMSADLVGDAFAGMIPLAKQMGPLLVNAFKAGEPVLRALGSGIKFIIQGLNGLFDALTKNGGSKVFSEFATAFMKALGGLLPVIGQLLRALAPLGTSIIGALVPAMQALVNIITKYVVPAADALGSFLSSHPGLVQGFAAAFVALFAALKGVTAFSTIAAVIGALVSPVGLVVAAIAALGVAFYLAYTRSQEFRTFVGQALASIQGFVQTYIIPGVQGIITAFQGLIAVVVPIVMQVVNAIKANWGSIQPYVTQVFNSIKSIIVNALAIIKQVITLVTSVISGIWKRWGTQITAFVVASFRNIMQVVGGLMKAIAGVVKLVLAVLKGDWTGAWNAIKQIVSGVWQAIRGIVQQGMNAAKAALGAGVAAAKALWNAAWNGIKSILTSAWNGIKTAVSNGINGMINLVTGIKDKVLGALAGANMWLYNAGMSIIQGLVDGIESMIGTVQDKLGKLTNMIPDWKGPKAKDKRLLRPTGKWIMEGLVKGFEDGRDGIRDSLGDITDFIEKTLGNELDRRLKAYNRKLKKMGVSQAARTKALNKYSKRWAKHTKAIKKSLNDETNALMKNAKKREKVYKRIAKAQEALNEIKKARTDYKNSVIGKMMDFVGLTNLNSAFNADAMLQQMKARIEKVKQFTAIIQDLIKKGLNKDMVNQLTQAGVEGGLAYALAIQQGGKDAITQFNNLQGQATTVAGTLGEITAANMFDAGVQAAQGLVKGLNSKKRQLERVAKSLARTLADAVKRALGIRSPSRVFARLGEQTMAGMEVGLKDTKGVTRAVVNMSDAMVNAFKQPTLTTTAQAGGTGNTTIQITVNVPPTADKAAIGREVAASLDAYYKQGGRRASL